MKLTLWQQFSSNHSASFSVVGVFESAEKAEEVASTIREVVKRIHDYYHKRFPDVMDFLEWAEMIDIRSLSPVEEAIRKEYKIRSKAWYSAIDWGYEGAAVRVHKNLLFVSNEGDTWAPFTPLDSLIKKAGGKFYGNQEGFGYAKFSLVCKAKDKASAVEIEKSFGLPEEEYKQIPDGLKIRVDVEAKGEKITFTGLGIYASSRNDNYDTATKLDSLVAYLEAQGCSDFQYKFKQG